MQVQLWPVIVVGTFLSYLMPGLLVIIVVPDRQSAGFIWTVSVYFVVASFLYMATLFRIFYKQKKQFCQPLYPDESKDSPAFVDCPPSYAEVAEIPPPYYLLPKSIQRSSSRLRRDYNLPEQEEPRQTPNLLLSGSSSRTFKRFVFRSKSLVTSSSTNYFSFESPSEAVFDLRISSNYSELENVSPIEENSTNPFSFHSQGYEKSSSSSRKSSNDSLSSLNQTESKRRLSLGLRNTLSCPLSPI